MSRFLSPTLSAVTPYTPGEQPQDQQYIKLNTNESPYLPSPAVVAAVSEAEVEKLRLYSDPACADLLRAAAAHFGLQPDQIMPGNGSDENLFFALRAFCDADHPLAYADITYGCYGVWCGLMHIPSQGCCCAGSRVSEESGSGQLRIWCTERGGCSGRVCIWQPGISARCKWQCAQDAGRAHGCCRSSRRRTAR